MSLTNTAESNTLNWLTGNTTVAPVLPLKVRLMTANGTDSVAGTELTGGTYAPQTVTFGASAAGAPAASDALVRFEGITPGADLTGLEIWDSATPPVRWHWASLTGAPVDVVDGILEFAAGAITLPAD